MEAPFLPGAPSMVRRRDRLFHSLGVTQRLAHWLRPGHGNALVAGSTARGVGPKGLGSRAAAGSGVLDDRLFGQGHLDILLDPLRPHAQRDRRAGFHREIVETKLCAESPLAVDGLDHVAGLEPGLVGRRPADDVADGDAAAYIAAELGSHVIRNVDRGDAEESYRFRCRSGRSSCRGFWRASRRS